MNKTKIHLSAEEMKLIQNADWILTKNRVIEKVYELFGELAAGMQSYIAAHANELPDIVVASTPKISRGEQYEGLPYVVLDYPRCFGKEETIAVRTLFWWGNYFSSTLHVKGEARNLILNNRLHSIIPGNSNMHVSDSGDEWSHNILSINYMSSRDWLSKKSSVDNENAFLKLTIQHPLQEWSTATVFLNRYFEQWMDLIKK